MFNLCNTQIDAILLGSLRIGHGFALAKHPTLLQLVKERDIAIEVNPLSNQVIFFYVEFYFKHIYIYNKRKYSNDVS